jgi:DNA-binding MarR family transcriptional regulator
MADEHTSDLLAAAARRVRRVYATALAEWDITPAQSRALRVLASADEGMRPSVLADELRIAPRSATEVADALERRGWIVRTADPQDRRATRLTLTEDGQALMGRIEEVRRAAGEQVLGVLPPAQRRTLDAILRVVVSQDQREDQ